MAYLESHRSSLTRKGFKVQPGYMSEETDGLGKKGKRKKFLKRWVTRLAVAGVIVGGAYIAGAKGAAFFAKKAAEKAKRSKVSKVKLQEDQTLIQQAGSTPVSSQAQEGGKSIEGTVSRVMNVASESAPFVAPMIAEKLMSMGIRPAEASEEDVRNAMDKTVKESGQILGMPWYLPVGGAILVTGFLLMRKGR